MAKAMNDQTRRQIEAAKRAAARYLPEGYTVEVAEDDGPSGEPAGGTPPENPQGDAGDGEGGT